MIPSTYRRAPNPARAIRQSAGACAKASCAALAAIACPISATAAPARITTNTALNLEPRRLA